MKCDLAESKRLTLLLRFDCSVDESIGKQLLTLDGISAQSILFRSWIPTTLMPLVTLLAKLDWSCFDREEKEGMAEFAHLLQRLAEGNAASVPQGVQPSTNGQGHGDLEKAGASEGVVSMVCQKGHIMKDCYSPADVALTLVNGEGNPVKLGTNAAAGVFGSASSATLYYCGQLRDIPGSDGRCGPNNGPQCASCVEFQKKNASKLAQHQMITCAACGTKKMMSRIGATCATCVGGQTNLCLSCCMHVRSCVYAPFGSCNSREDFMAPWLEVASFALRDLLGRKLICMSLVKSEGFLVVMSYRCLFANGLRAGPRHAAPELDTAAENMAEHMGATDGAPSPLSTPDTSADIADKRAVLLRLMELMQAVSPVNNGAYASESARNR